MGKHDPKYRKSYLQKRKKRKHTTVKDLHHNINDTAKNLPLPSLHNETKELTGHEKDSDSSSTSSRPPFIDTSTENSSSGFFDIASLASSHVRDIVKHEQLLKRTENDPLWTKFRAYTFHKNAMRRIMISKI